MTVATLSPSDPKTQSGSLLWLALATVYVVWGSTYLAIRVVVETMPPLLSAGARFLVAAGILAAVIAIRQGPRTLRLRPPQLAATAIVGILLLAGGNGGVMVAEQTVPSGLAALLVAAVPLWVVLLRTGSGDRPRRATLVGILLGFAGLVLLIRPDPSSGIAMTGTLLVLAASASWAIGSFWSGRLPMPRDPFVATVWEMVFGAAALLLAGLARGEAGSVDLAAVSGRSWLALAYLVSFGSLLAFTAYVWLLHNAPISLVATYAYVNPLIAVALGSLLLAEPLTASILIGGGIVVSAVGIVVTTERPAPAVTSEEEPAA